ncbi:hypothetical protein GMA3_12 [Gordonia phage GMA3]|uniref:Uncharacterized protein n=1 Tax=Gordonia phage GMA3 TaxID=1647284 RepID=A0A0K0NKT6_9CAUD|nr:hypothetical protein AU105_gp012 [Gordonia phage GMA3]AKL88189.1 hypothetical protein GMA3_12 [Gordonia phage GMA3]
MALSEEDINSKKARNADNEKKIAELNAKIAAAEAAANNDVRGEKLDREDEKQQVEIARLTALAESINGGGAQETAPAAANTRPTGTQRNPTNFGGAPAVTENKE